VLGTSELLVGQSASKLDHDKPSSATFPASELGDLPEARALLLGGETLDRSTRTRPYQYRSPQHRLPPSRELRPRTATGVVRSRH